MLGFVYYTDRTSTFVRTSSSCPPIADCGKLLVMDARHGRVLLQSTSPEWLGEPWKNVIVVWDPITNEQWKLPLLRRSRDPSGWNASVLCANYGICDHLDCIHGPFLVVLVVSRSNYISVYTYSSEIGTWNKPTTAWHPVQEDIDWHWQSNSALVGNALYIKFRYSLSILEFNLATRVMSVVDCANLMTTEAGGLGFAHLRHTEIYLWSRDAGPDGHVGWVQGRVIDCRTLIPCGTRINSFDVVGFADAVDVIFVCVNDEIFTFDLKFGQGKMVCKDGGRMFDVFPYTSFYTPGSRRRISEYNLIA
ncbi:hypothetical protein EJB05_13958, partial [Eragrostis curvula]